jgi:phosphoglycolate phosphatase-like HAD superfamily hydrolase
MRTDTLQMLRRDYLKNVLSTRSRPLISAIGLSGSMDLVMFDIDGTLTQTFAIDAECYVRALTEVSCFEAISTNWASYQHTTDSGILDEVYRLRLGQPPNLGEVSAVRDRFVQLLNQAVSNSPGAFAAVPGAQNFIDYLLCSGYALSLASGGWQHSALMKLKIAGLNVAGLPAAFADDAHSRRDIMKCSYLRACEAYGVTGFDAVIYVGDGSWDALASRSLGYTFIGIGSGSRASRLSELGAVDVLTDYSDIEWAKAALGKFLPDRTAKFDSGV